MMKRKYTVPLFTISILFFSWACKDKVDTPNPIAEQQCYLADSVITVNGEVSEQYTFSYNSEKEIISVKKDFFENGEPISILTKNTYSKGLKTGYTETKNGELFKQVSLSYFDDGSLQRVEMIGGDEFDKDRKEISEYNQKGFIIYKKIETSIMGTLESVFTYDQHDNLISEQNTSSLQAFYPTSYTYKYDNENRLTEKISRRYPNKTTSEQYKYDDRGNMIESSYSNQGVFNGGEIYTYTYNPDNTIQKKSIKSSTPPHTQFVRYEYDHAKRLLASYISGNDKDFAQNALYSYHPNGKHKEIAYTNWPGLTNSFTEEQPFSKTTMSYNEEGTLLKTVYTDYRDGNKSKTTVYQANTICD